MKLQGKVALITGGARGLGRATALAFAFEGAKVAVCDLQERAPNLLEELHCKGTTGAYFSCDVTKPDQVRRMAGEVAAALGRIDILINNAGITQDSSLLKMTQEQWDSVIAVNLTGVFNCTRAVAPAMAEAKSGRIINISSIVGLYGNFGQTNYAATKAGVIGMTRTWARELGPKGINVNAIAPGFIATEMSQKVPADVLEGLKQRTPLRRLGNPEDVASACVFLAGPDASFINGAVLSVDGGLTL